MRRFRVLEIVLGFGLGIIAALFIVGITSYQAQHCNKSRDATNASPRAESIDATDDRDLGNHKKSDIHRDQLLVCSIAGFPSAVLSFMDENEGFFVGIFTAFLFLATMLLWMSTRDLWKAGKEQLSIVRDDFNATHRPWLSFQVFIGPRGLYFDVNGANLDLIVNFKNVGNSPAINANVHINPFSLPKYEPGAPGQERVLKAQSSFCGTIRNRPFHPWAHGGVLFPGDNIIHNSIYSFCGKDELAAKAEEEFGRGQFLPPLNIVGCIDYMFSFGDGRRHQTGFAYEIFQIKPGQPGRFMLGPNKDFGPGELQLYPWHQGATFYAD
jgi:hypothetical protein